MDASARPQENPNSHLSERDQEKLAATENVRSKLSALSDLIGRNSETLESTEGTQEHLENQRTEILGTAAADVIDAIIAARETWGATEIQGMSQDPELLAILTNTELSPENALATLDTLAEEDDLLNSQQELADEIADLNSTAETISAVPRHRRLINTADRLTAKVMESESMKRWAEKLGLTPEDMQEIADSISTMFKNFFAAALEMIPGMETTSGNLRFNVAMNQAKNDESLTQAERDAIMYGLSPESDEPLDFLQNQDNPDGTEEELTAEQQTLKEKYEKFMEIQTAWLKEYKVWVRNKRQAKRNAARNNTTPVIDPPPTIYQVLHPEANPSTPEGTPETPETPVLATTLPEGESTVDATGTTFTYNEKQVKISTEGIEIDGGTQQYRYGSDVESVKLYYPPNRPEQVEVQIRVDGSTKTKLLSEIVQDASNAQASIAMSGDFALEIVT